MIADVCGHAGGSHAVKPADAVVVIKQVSFLKGRATRRDTKIEESIVVIIAPDAPNIVAAINHWVDAGHLDELASTAIPIEEIISAIARVIEIAIRDEQIKLAVVIVVA